MRRCGFVAPPRGAYDMNRSGIPPMSKRPLIFSLLLLAILLAQPAATMACMGRPLEGLIYEDVAVVDGEEHKRYYKKGDKCFPYEERNEYLFQRWPNIVVAKISFVTDLSGKTIPDFTPSISPGPKPKVKYHYVVLKSFKGDLPGSFQSVDPKGRSSTCLLSVRAGETYLMYLPELPETGVYEHLTISSSDAVRPVSGNIHYERRHQETIKWLERRVQSEPEDQLWFPCPAK